MSDGLTHQKITTALIVPTAVLAYALTGDLATAVVAGAGCGFTVACGPDLDLEYITQSKAVMLKAFRPLGWMWFIIWYPYAKCLPHRSPMSHWPILSTFVRDAYLLGIVYSIMMIFERETAVSSFVYAHACLVFAFVLGQICADTAHFLADVISTKSKAVFR